MRAEIEQFYARQVHLLNDGRIDAWALTFSEDAEFDQAARAGRVFARDADARRGGRETIAEAARGAIASLAEKDAVRRHWIGDMSVEPESADRVRTDYYAVILQTTRGTTAPALYLSTRCRDTLARDGENGWQVVRREITHDDR